MSPSDILAVQGESSEMVRGVRRLLALPDSDLFDEPMEQRLRGFQTVAGLVPNGWLTGLTYDRLRAVKGLSSDRGVATVSMAMVGSVVSGSPLIVALVNEDFTNGTAMVVSLALSPLVWVLGRFTRLGRLALRQTFYILRMISVVPKPLSHCVVSLRTSLSRLSVSNPASLF